VIPWSAENREGHDHDDQGVWHHGQTVFNREKRDNRNRSRCQYPIASVANVSETPGMRSRKLSWTSCIPFSLKIWIDAGWYAGCHGIRYVAKLLVTHAMTALLAGFG
jgi:hypothetical protein